MSQQRSQCAIIVFKTHKIISYEGNPIIYHNVFWKPLEPQTLPKSNV